MFGSAKGKKGGTVASVGGFLLRRRIETVATVISGGGGANRNESGHGCSGDAL